MTRYLQLRVHSLQCVQETQNRQNFMGIPLETDPDAIDVSAMMLDTANGLVVRAPVVYLGNRYRTGSTENFSTPKVVAEAPVSETDVFPRRISVTLNMAEKDDGAGFDELMDRVGHALADELGERLGDELGDDVSMSDLYREAETAAGDIFASLLKGIGDLLGLGDDPLVPATIACELARHTDPAPSGLRTVEFKEPNPAHKGKFVLTYGWHLSDRRALEAPSGGTGSGSGGTGTASAALSAATPYPKPFRTYRFRPPVRKPAAKTPAAAKPVGTIPMVKLPRPLGWWQPTPTRLFGAGRNTK